MKEKLIASNLIGRRIDYDMTKLGIINKKNFAQWQINCEKKITNIVIIVVGHHV